MFQVMIEVFIRLFEAVNYIKSKAFRNPQKEDYIKPKAFLISS